MRPFLVTFFFITVASGQQLEIGQASRTGYESISAEDLRAHVTFLSSDELEGRETSRRGQKIAAQYIATMFRKNGLKPLGEGGSYFQRFDLTVTKPSHNTAIEITTSTSSESFSFRKDFLTVATKETTLTIQAVFVGYMDAALSPEQESGLTGKIVVAFAGRPGDEPNSFERGRRRPFVRFFMNSAATFAITDETAYGSLEQQSIAFADQFEKGEMSLTYTRPERRADRFLVFTISSRMGGHLLRQFNLPLDSLRKAIAADSGFTPVPLEGISVTLDVKVLREFTSSENVVGLLEGSDPILKHEYVVLTAHYDHLGIGAADGEIYNGADDDGSGTSMILELAEAFTVNKVKPKRSLVFMTVAGEEKGLLGSRYYSDHPLVPLEKTAANVNIDMIGRTDEKYQKEKSPNYVYVIGSDKISTELDSLLHVANRKSVRLTLDYEYNDDNEPNQFYRRSDHYNFARKGVPVVFFFSGLHDDYHRPTDTVEKIEFETMARRGKLVYATVWEVANFGRLLKKHGKTSLYEN
ncbi:MAG: M28 family peptidase [Ignavibacteriales bacterium]|nr:M28 family peptidase [Ignavibacteriales bacterium]